MTKNNKKTRVDDASTLRANFAFRRESLQLRQSDIAERAGVSREFVSMVESGIRVPTLAVLSKLAEALETSSAALLTPDYFSDT